MKKPKGILFRAPMVRAVLAGTKTQTRRLVDGIALDWLAPGQFTPEYVADPGNHLCPYGEVGDLLWVKETWAYTVIGGHSFYRADDESVVPTGGKWKPSIFMPFERSRIMLQITAKRIERLQAISDSDALAEGIEREMSWDGWKDYGEPSCYCTTPQASYHTLWDSINPLVHGWDENDWVWVISFKRIIPMEDLHAAT